MKMEMRAAKRRIDEIDNRIESLSKVIDGFTDGYRKSYCQSKLLNTKLKKQKLVALSAFAEAQKVLVEMDTLIAENDLCAEIESINKCKIFRNPEKKVKREVIEIIDDDDDDLNDTLVLERISRQSTPIPTSHDVVPTNLHRPQPQCRNTKEPVTNTFKTTPPIGRTTTTLLASRDNLVPVRDLSKETPSTAKNSTALPPTDKVLVLTDKELELVSSKIIKFENDTSSEELRSSIHSEKNKESLCNKLAPKTHNERRPHNVESYETFRSNLTTSELEKRKTPESHRNVVHLYNTYKEIYYPNKYDINAPSLQEFKKLLIKDPSRKSLPVSVSEPRPVMTFLNQNSNQKSLQGENSPKSTNNEPNFVLDTYKTQDSNKHANGKIAERIPHRRTRDSRDTRKCAQGAEKAAREHGTNAMDKATKNKTSRDKSTHKNSSNGAEKAPTHIKTSCDKGTKRTEKSTKDKSSRDKATQGKEKTTPKNTDRTEKTPTQKKVTERARDAEKAHVNVRRDSRASRSDKVTKCDKVTNSDKGTSSDKYTDAHRLPTTNKKPEKSDMKRASNTTISRKSIITPVI